jgi:hypothetical protein
MPRVADVLRRSAPPLALFLAGAAVFAAACCQAPLYYSNQNQYFLHGLAGAGVGRLKDDWLAGTRDPTPLFSALVAVTARWLHPWAFHLCYALLQGAYAAALFGVFVAVVGRPVAARRWPVFVALFVAAHAALLRWGSYRLLGNDYPWFLQAGVAGQYVLGAMFQPSVFGVLLIVAVCLFAHDRPFAAAACAALGATVHSTYLLSAGLLTLGFLTSLLLERRPYRALAVGGAALALVLPVIAHVLLTFAPTSAESFARSQDVLVNFRIPHHCRPDLWLDWVAAAQIAWFGLGLALTWRTRLFPGAVSKSGEAPKPDGPALTGRTRLFAALAVPALLALLLTLAEVLTGSNTLALLFPWRVSAVLVPVATAVILSRLTAALPAAADGKAARAAAVVVVAVCVAGGVWIMAARKGYLAGDEELAVMDFVRRSQEPRDVYFVPVTVPNLARTTRGSLSSDFKPLADKKQDTRVIPVDLQRFRLAAEAPIYVDFKSIPYKDTEVQEWHARVRFAEEVQERIKEGKGPEALADLRNRGVTHVVWPVARGELGGDGVEKVYEDPYYRVYRLNDVP